MRKQPHALVPPTMEVLEPKPTRVDTFSHYLLAVFVLLAIALATGNLVGLIDVYGGLL